jgi:surface polysaccharide O-acyltransferase-like enzyme
MQPNLCRYSTGSKLACVLHNFVSIFTVPSFVLISGRLG